MTTRCAISSGLADIVGEGRRPLAPAQRDAVGRMLLAKPRARLPGRIEEAVEVAHRPGRQVVEDEQRPGLRPALRQRALDPAVRIAPVARDRVPEDAAVALALEVRGD